MHTYSSCTITIAFTTTETQAWIGGKEGKGRGALNIRRLKDNKWISGLFSLLEIKLFVDKFFYTRNLFIYRQREYNDTIIIPLIVFIYSNFIKVT